MRFRSGILGVLALGLVLGGCATAGTAGPEGPSVSPTGKTYEPGIRPRQSDASKRALVLIAQKDFAGALTEARQGIAADSANPIHYFLAGQALAGLGEYEEADELYDRAQQIFPAYELEIEPLREQAWAEAFNQGVTAYNANDVDAALEWWEKANLIYPYHPQGYQNMAAILTQRGDYDRAVEIYNRGLQALETTPETRQFSAEEQVERDEARGAMRENVAELLLFQERFSEAEALFREQLAADPDNVALQSKLAAAIASQPGREAEAQELYNELLAQPNLATEDYFNIGVALFNAKNYARAGEAFGKVAEARRHSRDAWYNYANALYAAEDWQPLVPVAEQLVQVDPLNEDAGLILARAYRDTEQNQKALNELERLEALPVKLKDLTMRLSQGKTKVSGTVVGNAAAAGTPVAVRFTFFDENGATLGTETVTVNAPEKEATSDFEVELSSPGEAAAYRYELAG